MAHSTTTLKTFANKLDAKVKVKLEKAKGKLRKLKPSNKAKKAIVEPADAKNNMTIAGKNIEDNVDPNNMAVVEPQIKAVLKPVTKSMAELANTSNNVVNSNNIEDQGHFIVSETKHAGDEGNLNPLSSGCDVIDQAKAKATRHAARKQARKERWSTRRATLKAKAKKIGEALFFPALVIGGVVFAPVVLAISIVFFVVKMVVILVLHILDLIFCCPVLTCYIASDL